MKIGIFFNKKRKSETEKPARDIYDWLKSNGHSPYLNPHKETMLRTLNFAVAIGGDGTVLGLANTVARFRIPLVGINFGHKGWLCAISGDEIKKKLGIILQKDLKNKKAIDRRTRVKAKVSNNGKKIIQIDGLNEIVIGGIPKTVSLEVEIIDGYDKYFVWIIGDGIIITTKTGSTAYWKNARGPPFTVDALGILANNAIFEDPKGIILSDIYNPLPQNTEAIVSSRNVVYKIRILNEYKDNLPYLIADGQRVHRLHKGDKIEIKRSRNKNLFIRV
jgi:NAD+ kinase